MKRNNKSTAVGRFALSCVAAAALTASMGDAFALGLGRLSVQSALGEGLRAEIDVTSLSPEEAGSLRARIASPDAYRTAGVEYNPVLPAAQVSLQKRADGRSILRIRSDRAVQEPFVDLILELSWNGGRLVREYTLLFDPPSNQAPAAPQPLTAPVMAQPAPPPAPLPPLAAPPVAAPPVAAAAAPAAPERQRAEKARPPASETAAASADPVRVRPGDSLTRIASRVQAAGVSLDQMVVSLYRANPQAFMGDNMNRLKAGAVLTVPDAEQAQAVSTSEARRLIHVQSADFAAYRQRVAAAAGLAADEPLRQSSGRVEAAVEDRKTAAAPSPDRLTLSKGAIKGDKAPEDGIAKQREQEEASTRVAELSRNIEELQRLQVPAGTPAAPAPQASAAGSVPGIAVPLAVPAAEPASAVAVAEAAAAASAAEPASAPTLVSTREGMGAQPEASPVPAAPVSYEGPSAVDMLLEDPLALPLAGGLVLLLGGLGAFRVVRARKKKAKESAETSFLESRLQPDSFFGASGGGHVDTSSTPASPSLSYSLSQIDAIGDVDPVAEADVYLAYGRDLQAEEILKEAMRTDPDRLAVRTKMLEVYAKRRDTRGFEALATQLHGMTGGEGEDWARACEMGQGIDPDNPLYKQRPATPAMPAVATPAPAPATTPAASTAVAAAVTATAAMPSFAEPDVSLHEASVHDVDLDLSEPLDAEAPGEAAIDLEATRPLPTGTVELPELPDLDLPAAAPAAAAPVELESLSFDLTDEPFAPAPVAAPLQAPAPVAAPTPAPAAALASASDASLDFDLGGLTLDFDAPAGPPAASSAAPQPSMSGALDGLDDLDLLGGDDEGDPLARKLELADEFIQIGDYEGARELLQEVVAQAQGPLKTKAQGLLDEMA